MRRIIMVRILLWGAVAALMAVIFAFSAQPGAESDALTQPAAMPIAELMASMQDGADEATLTAIYNIVATIIRKMAHLGEYALLGLFTALALNAHGYAQKWLPVLIGVAYAATDELHQAFVPERLGTPVDVMIDAVGVIVGVWIAAFLIRIRRKSHVHDQ